MAPPPPSDTKSPETAPPKPPKPPLNVRVSVPPSDLWLLLPRESAGAAERLGLRVQLAANVDKQHSDPAAEPDGAISGVDRSAEMSVKIEATVRHLGSDLISLTWPPAAAADGRAAVLALGAPLLEPLTVHVSAEEGQLRVGSLERAATLRVRCDEGWRFALSTPQLRVVSQLAQLAEQTSAEQSRAAHAKPKRRQAQAALRPSTATATDDDRPSVLSTALATRRLSVLTIEGAVPGGLEATLYGASGAPHHPLGRVRVPELSVGLQLDSRPGVSSHHAMNFVTGFEMLTWARAAQAWEPCLVPSTVSFQAQQVRGGIWSGCVEVESMEVVVSEPVVQRLLDMSAVVQLALNTPTLDIEALRRTPPPPVVQLTNQSGCPLRLRVRGSDTPVLVPTGETRAVAATDALIAVEEISLMAGGAWHILPPLPAGRFGSWTVLGERRDERRAEPRPSAGAQLGAPAHRRSASSGAHLGAPSAAHHRTPSSGTGSASGGAPPVGEPVAVQCTVRAMTDDAAGVHGPGVAVVVRSLAMVHNATSTPLALQLLLPVANGPNGPNGSHDESEPTVPAPPSALDLGVDSCLILASCLQEAFIRYRLTMRT